MMAGLKLACQAASGKGTGLEEACKAAAGREVGEVTLQVGDANGASAFVTDLGVDPTAAVAEHVDEFSQKALEARARAPPLMFDVAVPKDASPGQKLKAMGPSGPVVLEIPPDAVPGGSMRFAMKPKPRYLVDVPKKAGPGWTIKFRPTGGEVVAVVVPPGFGPGDSFEVTPPALMVEVPEDAQPGDLVKFVHVVGAGGNTSGDSGAMTECFRAVVPEGLRPKQHFVAIIPPPGKQPSV